MLIDPKAPITAVTLLDCFDENFGCSDVVSEWKTSGSPVAMYRQKQLRALFAAFGIEPNPRDLANGRFLLRRGDRRVPLLGDDVHTPFDLIITFRYLRSYRCQIRRSTETGIFFACPRSLAYALRHQVQSARDAVRHALRPIDDVLCSLIDPAGRTFTVDYLIFEHGYPVEDCGALEREEENQAWLWLEKLEEEVDRDDK